jgi:hypothetical protein
MLRAEKPGCSTFTTLCGTFAQAFREIRADKYVYDGIGEMKQLHTPEIKELCAKIGGGCYGYTHNLAWTLIGLYEKT